MAQHNSAMDHAAALWGAAGEADRKAREATVPFNPPLQNLRFLLFLYAATTRIAALRDLVPAFRDRARQAVACFRELRAEEAAL